MKKLFSIVFNILLIITVCYAQKPNKAEKKLYRLAKKQLTNEDYKEAQASYLKLIKTNPTNEIYQFEGGLSYYFSDFDRAKGIPLFESSLKNSKEDTIPETYYYLGRSYLINGEYEKCKTAFNKFKPFIETSSNAGQELMRKTDYFVKISDRGNHFLINKNENAVATNLGEKINSSYGEYAPVLKKDDNVLLFTSRRKSSLNKRLDKDLLPYENIYVAKKVNGEWQILTNKKDIEKFMPKNLNSKKHDAGIIYSSDGKTLYTYKNDLIWKSILENGSWSKLVELDENINTSKYNTPSVSISKDGNTLFFVSNRKDGLGGKDIYTSTKTNEGNWGEAELMSNAINSQLDEDSPFISEDGKTFYFSSKGHQGIGGYDVYRSRLVDGKWSTAENMGIPVNSPSDDIYFIIDNIENNGFFASARDGGIGGMDIYQICMNCPKTIKNTINGLLVNTNEQAINDGEIIIKDVSSDNPIGTYQTKLGKFSMTTEKTGEQELMVEAPNYDKQIVYLNLPKVSSETDIKITLKQFERDTEKYQVLNLVSKKLGVNKSDTIKVEKVIASIEKESIDYDSSSNLIGTYKELYSYNSNKFDTSNPDFIALIDKIINEKGNGKIYLDIESSASRVPTNVYNSNTKLALSRGEKAKEVIIEALKARGINKNRIVIKPITPIVSGPKYNGDFKNTRKYGEFQYVKVTVK